MRAKMFLMVVVLTMLAASFAFADDAREAEVEEGETGSYDETDEAGNHTAEGGNVTEINLTTESSTAKWQGFYGSTQASLFLGMGSEVFYDFGNETVSNVYATTSESAFDVESLEAVDASAVDGNWSFNSTDTDSAVNVYDIEHNGFNATETNNGNTTFVAATVGEPTEKQHFVFGGVVLNGLYELLVPTEESEVYNFFMEI